MPHNFCLHKNQPKTPTLPLSLSFTEGDIYIYRLVSQSQGKDCGKSTTKKVPLFYNTNFEFFTNLNNFLKSLKTLVKSLKTTIFRKKFFLALSTTTKMCSIEYICKEKLSSKITSSQMITDCDWLDGKVGLLGTR